jgi:hypothetical protein
MIDDVDKSAHAFMVMSMAHPTTSMVPSTDDVDAIDNVVTIYP